MKKYIPGKGITLFYVTSATFPAGVLATHQKLHSLVPFSTERKYFSISFPDATGTLIYKAAAEELVKSEAEEKGMEIFILEKGTYSSIRMNNYMNDIPAIGMGFKKLLPHPEPDHKGACVESYLNNKDVQCMVRLTK